MTLQDSLIGIIYILFSVSLFCYILTAFILYKSKRNPLIFFFCIAGMVICLSALLSLVYDHKKVLKEALKTKFKNNPSTACIVQGAMVSSMSIISGWLDVESNFNSL